MQIEKTTVNIGFNPLTDCASVVMAAMLGFDEKHGIRIALSRETSWAGVRDKLMTGELDAAHALYGLIYGTQLGIGAQPRDMAVLMNLNRNGQSITLSRRLAGQGATDGASLAALMARNVGENSRQYVFAQTFPTGTHAMWLYYWLAAHGIHPMKDVRAITVPPSQMVYNLVEGHMDGFCAGDPWGHQAVLDGVGVTATTSQQIWPDHPEKVLGASLEFVRAHPNTCRALVAAVLEAGRWIDASDENRRATAEIIAAVPYIDTGKAAILPRMLGRYDDGAGHAWRDEHPMCFHQDGQANYPWLSDGMWFMTQFRRWGLLKTDPDYLAVAQSVTQLRLYREAAEMAGVAVPEGVLRTSTLVDGHVWDGTDPEAYAASFPVHMRN
ncbi:CmpA/NrtA family ABC transporter substrate-binding protein [Pseudoduganella umbonata]|uniref:ABC transporter substrate-binding protein n=1 Tax=Pseudoduganella umbonata TaxID=864828 RepID=A0A4P8HQH9_9BURK|nr:CmpA/NrtA family ABC transporter substrate-binding protein [Pseudoduganella umbonata]MBB3220421.1 nitrate/nitrite transport system substrate-binding protein [Pseudoduganella umbonata]QCP12049.1 ABC transporter substrate-binding protein [Pseudoduganella umbonata]